MSLEGSWIRLTIDIRDYLKQRFPDCPGTIIEGMVIEILHKVVPYTSDVIAARDKVWEDCIKERLNLKTKEN